MAEDLESTPEATGAGSPDRLRAIVLVGLAAVALLLSVEPTLLDYWSVRLVSLVLALFPGVLLAMLCAVPGELFFRKYKPGILPPVPRVLLSFVFGMGCVSVVVGASGFSTSLDSAAGLIFTLLLTIFFLRAGRGFRNRQPWRLSLRQLYANKESYGFWQSLSVGGLLAVTLAMVFVFSLTPPVLFDVTEYHLGAWSDYLKNGEFVAMPHNFYARFPFPIESLYFFGLWLTPYIDTAPKVFNAICVSGCGLAAGVFVRWCGGNRTAQLLAALAAITLPVMLEVSVDAMIDAPVALLIITSFMMALYAAGKFPTQTSGEPALSLPSLFLFITALTTKYTVAQLYLLPWLLICLPALMSRAARPSAGRIFGALIFSAVPPLVWFGKNWFLYGNPLEPFFVSIFRPEDAAGIAREKFYIESHFPQSMLSASYWTTLLPRLHEFVWLYLVLCIALFFVKGRAVAVRVLIFAGVSFLLWNLVRESQDRFLLPVMVLVAATGIAAVMSIPSVMPRRVLAAIVLIFCSMQTATFGLKLHNSGAVDYVLDFYPGRAEPKADDPATPREVFLEKNLGDLGKTLIDIRKQIPDGKLLLVYEARPYLFRYRAEDPPVSYNVVWDDSVLLNTIRSAENVEEAWHLLSDAGYSHLLINRQELLRYIQQYARPRQLRRVGVRPGDDPWAAWSRTSHPEDFYPPFYRDRDWEKLRTVVHELLADADRRAIIRHGFPAASPQSQPIDIIVAPVPAR